MTVSLGVRIFFLLIPLLADAYMPFEDCGSEYYLESIQVSGCPTYPCRLRIGSVVNVTTNLKIIGTAVNSQDLLHEVYFVVNTLLLRVQVSPDPCAASRTTASYKGEPCDLENGARIRYEAILNVSGVPPLPAQLYWTIRIRATRRLLVCYKISVILTRTDF